MLLATYYTGITVGSLDWQHRNFCNDDVQCGCSDMMRVEDGKLHSHLKWPNTQGIPQSEIAVYVYMQG